MGKGVARWYNGYDVGLATQRVTVVRLPAVQLSGNNLRQVVHTRVPLSLSRSWYWSNGDDALQLGR